MLNGAYFPNADGTFICAGGASPPMLRRPLDQTRAARARSAPPRSFAGADLARAARV